MLMLHVELAASKCLTAKARREDQNATLMGWMFWDAYLSAQLVIIQSPQEIQTTFVNNIRDE